MKLHQVNLLALHAGEGCFNGLSDLILGDFVRRGDPLGEKLSVFTSESLTVNSRDFLRRAVVIRHVKRRKTCVHVSLHGLGSLVWVDFGSVPLEIGDLPKSGQSAANSQPRGEFMVFGDGHISFQGEF